MALELGGVIVIALAVGELTAETAWQRLLVYLAVTGAYLIGRLGDGHA